LAQTAPDRGVQAVDRPQFIDKVRDVVGLYLNPPEAALVLCVTRRRACRCWTVPLVWTKTADQILDTIAHCQRINDTGH